MKIVGLQRKLSVTLCSLLFASSSLFADEKKINKLDTVTIIGQDDSSYIDYDKPSITRGNIDLEDTSRSVQIFNDKFIENYQAKDVSELPSLSSNVTYGGHNRSRGINFYIRGFNNNSILRDGLSIPNAIPNTEVYNLDRIEVLKGPDSIQFGQSNPGGLINFVKKKPLKEEHAEILLDVNDNAAISPKVDFGGSIGNKLSYRVVASYTKDETFKNHKNDYKRVFVAPTLTYDINDNNSIDFIFEVNNEDKPYDFGAISYKNKGKLMHDRDKTISNPYEVATREQTTYGFDYKNILGNFESLFRYRHVDHEFDLPMSYFPRVVDYTNKLVTGSFAKMNWKDKADIFQYTLSHKYENGFLKNNFNFGLDYTNSQRNEYTGVSWGTTQTFDLKNGNYPKLPNSTPSGLVPFGYPYTPNGTDKQKNKGVFIQNSLTINENFIINTGLRYDKVKVDNRMGSYNSYEKDNLTPQLGFVYKINPNSSIYANYSESFLPQTNKNKSGKFLDPETGKGFEIGLRQALFNNKLNLTTSIFKIEKENVAISTGGAYPYEYFSASGKQQSKGFEIDLGGNITDNFAILASYGYAKTKDEDGKRFDNVAQHTGNIYGTYRIDDIYLSAGVQYVGSRYYGDVKYDSHLVTNTNISYKQNSWTANFGVKNLTDEIYFSSVGTRPGASSIGTPRTIYANISYRF